MGKGNRNRFDRSDAVTEPKKVAPKAKKAHKPLAKTAKVAIACALAFLIVAGIVVGALWSNGVFRSRTPLIESKQNGEYNLTKAAATYLLWDTHINYYYSYYSSIFSSSSYSSYAYFYALSSARSTFTDSAKLRTQLEDAKDNLIGYVAVCDIASKADINISLTAEEIKTAKENALTMLDTWVTIANNFALSNLSSSDSYTQKDYHKDICSNTSDFLKKYVGSDVTKQDVQQAAVVAALYNKVLTAENEKVEETLIKDGIMDQEQLEAYRDGNKSDFFSSDYISVDVTGKDQLKADLLAATDLASFKKVLANYVGNDVYDKLFNSYATENGETAESLYNLLKGTYNKGNLETFLGMTYASESTISAAEDIKTWLTDSKRTANDTTVITVDGKVYAVSFLSKSTTKDSSESVTTYNYALKQCDSEETAKKLTTLLSHLSSDKFESSDNTALGDLLTIVEKQKADAIELPDTVKNWLTDSSRSTGDTETITISGDGIYVLLHMGKTTENSDSVYTYAYKKYDVVTATDDFKGDDRFKQNLINSVLIHLDLIEEDADNGIKETYQSDYELGEDATDEEKARHEVAAKMLDDMIDEIEDALDTDNAKYNSAPEEGDDERKDLVKWLFGAAKDDAPAGVGSITSIDETEKTKDKDGKETETTTTTVYCVAESMKLDTETAIWGGYLTFTGTDRENEAAEALAKLTGKSGLELWRALDELNATLSYGIESSDLSSKSDLSKWFFDEERKNGDMATVNGKETTTSSSSSSSSSSTSQTTTTEVTYVAVVIEKTVCWKATAMSGAITQALEDFIDEASVGYTWNQAIINKLPEETTEEETA